MKRTLVIWLTALMLAIGGFGAAVVDKAAAHSYVIGVSCLNYQIFYVKHIDVNLYWDRHETRVRPMTYNEYMYYCY